MSYAVAGLGLPRSPNEKIHRILLGAVGELDAPDHTILPWNAAYFKLDQVRYFQQASIEAQTQILQIANQQLLEEAYFVEKAGMGYMAKMVLLAETLEERMLYSLFCADESHHLSQIRGFLTDEPLDTSDPFFQLLATMVEGNDRSILMFVIQIVLEGWGLSHYRSLAKDCQNPDLAAILASFLQAESKHHATGVTLFQTLEPSQHSQTTMLDILAQFLQMVQVGPQGIVNTIEQCLGHFTPAQRAQVFEQLDTQTHSGTRLNLLQGLMQTGGGGLIVQQLIERGSFHPFPPEICAKIP